ncbi:hypothetical protein [Amycolatopsis samaneae]|uniref:DUF222 domain-containing protein n=1 Tax=Amycolatopsis samaneae TaxID=664691 RepID=A0ABW5GXV2_9PSEU
MNEDPARRAVRELHTQVAALPIATNLWQIRLKLHDVAEHVLHGAWDPRSEQLLGWPIYRDIALACEADSDVLDTLRRLHHAAARARSPQRLAESADPPTIPRMALVEPSVPQAPEHITTEKGFIQYLKHLVTRTNLPYRRIQKRSAALDPQNPIPKSTLSDLFKRDTVPNEALVRNLLTIVLSAVPGTESTPLARQVEDTMAVWKRVRDRPAIPPGAPVLSQATPRPAVTVLDDVVRELITLEAAARLQGRCEAPGLRQAILILLRHKNRARSGRPQ